MLTTKIIRLVKSLADHKGRREEGMFVAEGSKSVCDTIDAFRPLRLFATEEWLVAHPREEALAVAAGAVVELCKKGQLRELTSLVATPPVIAVYALPEPPEADPEDARSGLVLALDRVQDPGNLGTILRTADWFGVRSVVASKDTVDQYNPKAVQSSMGSISRMRVAYVESLADYLEEVSESGAPVYGTFLDGKDIYTSPLTETGVVLMGNEGSGIGPSAAAAVTHRLRIPNFPPDSPTGESLNVAIATAVTLAEFRRRSLITNG